MKKTNYILSALFGIIVLTLVILVIISNNRALFLYCSPTSPRGNDLSKWQETITSRIHNLPFDSNFLNEFKVGSDNEKYTVEYPNNSYPEDPFAFELHELIPGQTLEIGEGTLDFFGLGTALCDANHISNDDVLYKFFDAQLQPLSNENVNAFWYYQTSENDSNFRYSPWPKIQLGFEYQGIEDVMFNGIKIIDVRTHNTISAGYSSTGTHAFEKSAHRFTVDIPFWHHAPVDIIIDVSFGPSKIFEFLPKANEGFKEGGFECRLVGVLEGVDPRHHNSMSFNNKEIHEYPKSTTNLEGVCFSFACLPAANQMPVTFTFIGHDGKQLPGPGYSTSGFTQDFIMQQSLDKVALIRAQCRTNRYRIIIHLPYIPGLPEQNKNVDNLFGVYIPYVKLYDVSQMNRFLYETLQLSHSQGTGQRPDDSIYNASFPIELRGVTVRDIAKLYSTGGSLNVNIEDDRLELKYPVPFLTKMKILFQKLHQNE